LIVFAGLGSGAQVYDDVWTLSNADGSSGSPVWQQLTVAGTQLIRFDMTGKYDPATNRLIVFGGRAVDDGTSPALNDTWVLTNANGLTGANQWEQIAPSTALPPGRQISTSIYDPVTNHFTIFGGVDGPRNQYLNDTWVLTSANGITGSQLQISSITPNVGGNAGSTTVNVVGAGFQAGAQVTLSGPGSADISGTSTNVVDAGLLTATFNLQGASSGARDLVVTNPDNNSVSLSSVFTIGSGGAPNLSLQIVGGDTIRFGTTRTFYGIIQNLGDVDSANIAAYFDQPGSQASAYFGPLDALSSITIPFPVAAPASGCALVGGGLHVLNSNDPCTVLKAMKASADAYLNYLYGLRLANLETLEKAIINQDCFNPSVPSSITVCDGLEFTDKFFKTQIDAAESAEDGLCAIAEAVKCTMDCGDPLDINALDLIGNDVAASIASLKQIFLLVPIPLDQVLNEDLELVLLEDQTQDLTTSLVFPSQPQPEPPTDIPSDNSTSLQICGAASVDPNSKSGPSGTGTSKFVPGSVSLPYDISFGNETTATAPAEAVSVTDPIDPNVDRSTLALGAITFLDQVITPPPGPLLSAPFQITVDLRPTTNLLVGVTAYLNSATDTLNVAFQSIDPTTNQPPTDPTVGFLPPGAEGSVFFTALPKTGVTTGTVIQNTAAVVFDVNAPISTPTWSNTVDSTPPSSSVTALPATEYSTNFNVRWSGSDIGAGIQSFTVYVSDDGGPYAIFDSNTAAPSATFTGQPGHTYSFYSIAQDLVGNVEPAKTNAEATTQIVLDTTAPVTMASISPAPNANNWNDASVVVTLNSADMSGVNQITYSAAGAQAIPGTNFVGASTSFTISAQGATTVSFFATDKAGNIETVKTLTVMIDETPPISHVVALPASENSASFNVAWTGTDNLSGIQSLTIYVSDNGGPYTAFQTNTTATSASFTGQFGHTYSFYSIATDFAGNVEGPKVAAEGTTSVVSPCATDLGSSVAITRSGYSYSPVLKRYGQTVTLTNTGTVAIMGPISLVLDGLSSNATLLNPTGKTACIAPSGSSYISIVGPLGAGASATITLQFSDPSLAGITYSTDLVAGSGSR
jgi:hypothetical protein